MHIYISYCHRNGCIQKCTHIQMYLCGTFSPANSHFVSRLATRVLFTCLHTDFDLGPLDLDHKALFHVPASVRKHPLHLLFKVVYDAFSLLFPVAATGPADAEPCPPVARLINHSVAVSLGDNGIIFCIF